MFIFLCKTTVEWERHAIVTKHHIFFQCWTKKICKSTFWEIKKGTRACEGEQSKYIREGTEISLHPKTKLKPFSYLLLIAGWLASLLYRMNCKNNLMETVQFVFVSLLFSPTLAHSFYIWLESLWRLISALNDWSLILFASGFLISFNCFQFYYHYFCFYCSATTGGGPFIMYIFFLGKIDTIFLDVCLCDRLQYLFLFNF